MKTTNRIADRRFAADAEAAAGRLRTGCFVFRVLAASIALACSDAAAGAPASAAPGFQTIAILAAIIASTTGWPHGAAFARRRPCSARLAGLRRASAPQR